MKGGENSNDQRILAGIFTNDLNSIIHQLYNGYGGVVIAYIINNGGSQQDGEDVFQETLIAFIDLVKSGKFRGEASLQTAFVSIARNIWLNEGQETKEPGNPRTDLRNDPPTGRRRPPSPSSSSAR